MKHSSSQQVYTSAQGVDRRQSLAQGIKPMEVLELQKDNNYIFLPDFETVSKPLDAGLQECPICLLSFGIMLSKQCCLRCGRTVCKSCVSNKVNSKRTCDLCFYELANYADTKARMTRV